MRHSIDFVDDLMQVLDEDGNGYDCHVLTTHRKAQRQLEVWSREYTFDVAEAAQQLAEYFEADATERPRVQTARDTQWTTMSVPGRENADGTETPTAWFAYNRQTRKSIRFSSFDEAERFVRHPDNRD